MCNGHTALALIAVQVLSACLSAKDQFCFMFESNNMTYPNAVGMQATVGVRLYCGTGVVSLPCLLCRSIKLA